VFRPGRVCIRFGIGQTATRRGPSRSASPQTRPLTRDISVAARRPGPACPRSDPDDSGAAIVNGSVSLLANRTTMAQTLSNRRGLVPTRRRSDWQLTLRVTAPGFLPRSSVQVVAGQTPISGILSCHGRHSLCVGSWVVPAESRASRSSGLPRASLGRKARSRSSLPENPEPILVRRPRRVRIILKRWGRGRSVRTDSFGQVPRAASCGADESGPRPPRSRRESRGSIRRVENAVGTEGLRIPVSTRNETALVAVFPAPSTA